MGRRTFSDVVADPDMDAVTEVDMAAWTGCIAMALPLTEMTDAGAGAGFALIEISPTHRVHTRAQTAIIRAVLPSTEESSPRRASDTSAGAALPTS